MVKAQGFPFFGLVLRQILQAQTSRVFRMLLHFIDYRLRYVAFVKGIHAFFGNALHHVSQLWITQYITDWMWRSICLVKVCTRTGV